MNAPFDLVSPGVQTLPAVLSVPHAGRVYPPEFLAATRLGIEALRRSEDREVDCLLAGAASQGMPVLSATIARSCIDLSRAEGEIDEDMLSGPAPVPIVRTPRLASGLGLIMRHAATGAEIPGRKLAPDEVLARLDRYYRPYHARLAALMEATRRRFGAALLIDGHSMPALAGAGEVDAGKRRPDIVLGDRLGRSAPQAVIDAARAAFRTEGFSLARNSPYAGGHITGLYGRPEAGFFALQIEVNRALYLDERTLSRRRDFDRVAAALVRALTAIAKAVPFVPLREAAE
ncbi:MAG: N-formylglutamate amidohydrolase [Alphaproteobacteria bacterium]|nr:N-formylglutamate amidohydrolase [Alphaproteobacteria bacterium]